MGPFFVNNIDTRVILILVIDFFKMHMTAVMN